MDLINWDYERMYDWYKNHAHLRQTADLTAIIYTSQKVSKGHVLEPFIKPHITYIGRISQRDMPRSRYTEGAYLVMDDNKSLKKWMFLVTPATKECGSQRTSFADHFTFCIEKSDKKTPLHFHSTNYDCVRNRSNMKSYKYFHKNDYFELKRTIPRQDLDNTPIKDPWHQGDKPYLLNFIRRPWQHGDPDEYTDRDSLEGGGKRRQHVPARPMMCQDFCDKWQVLKCKRMSAFGFRQDDGSVQWSVNLICGRLKRNQLGDAYYFSTPNDGELTFQQHLARVVGDIRS